MGQYLKKLRRLIGKHKIIHPGARIIIENKNGEILFIRRKDNGKWGIPAGSLEEGENILDCITREVKEETGLDLITATVIGISSNPCEESVRYPNGDQIQYFTIEFYAAEWKGNLDIRDQKEVSLAVFLSNSYLDELPNNEFSAWESLIYFRKNARIRVS